MNKYKKLFEPVKIGNCEIKNRFALAPMGPLGLADSEGGFNQRGIDYYTERAKGGTGLIITGVTFVDNEVEEHVAAARRFYNSAVLELNNAVEIFPSSIFAAMVGAKKQEFFQAEEAERKAINASDFLK